MGVTIWGRTLDERYVQTLMTHTELTLEDALLLDNVQKGRPITTAQTRHLRALRLVEGRSPKLHISAQVAVATGQEVEYLNHKGLDSKHYKGLVLELLALKPQRRAKINAMLLPKLPTAIAPGNSQKTYIKNLLQDMVREQLIENAGGATQAALWRLKK